MKRRPGSAPAASRLGSSNYSGRWEAVEANAGAHWAMPNKSETTVTRHDDTGGRRKSAHRRPGGTRKVLAPVNDAYQAPDAGQSRSGLLTAEARRAHIVQAPEVSMRLGPADDSGMTVAGPRRSRPESAPVPRQGKVPGTQAWLMMVRKDRHKEALARENNRSAIIRAEAHRQRSQPELREQLQRHTGLRPMPSSPDIGAQVTGRALDRTALGSLERGEHLEPMAPEALERRHGHKPPPMEEFSVLLYRDEGVGYGLDLVVVPVHSAHSELLTRAYTSKLSSPRQRSIRLISQRGALAASSAHAA